MERTAAILPRLARALTIASVAIGMASQTGARWPPGLQSVPDDSPALSPEAEMKTFVLPPGYRVELVASEPLVEEPVLIDWDPSGRMWVVEMLGYMQDMPATNEREPIGRISVLEDTEPRRPDGQEDGVPRRPRAAAGAEGPRQTAACSSASRLICGWRATRTAT